MDTYSPWLIVERGCPTSACVSTSSVTKTFVTPSSVISGVHRSFMLPAPTSRRMRSTPSHADMSDRITLVALVRARQQPRWCSPSCGRASPATRVASCRRRRSLNSPTVLCVLSERRTADVQHVGRAARARWCRRRSGPGPRPCGSAPSSATSTVTRAVDCTDGSMRDDVPGNDAVARVDARRLADSDVLGLRLGDLQLPP